jgi:DNA-binding MarR family transcriptional regulator
MRDVRSFTQIMYSFGNMDFSKFLNNCSKAEYVVLSKIDEYIEINKVDYINVTKLSELLNVSTPAISRVLKSLESKKYIIRDIDVFCRRNTLVRLTSIGNKELKDCNDKLKSVFDDCFNGLSSEEQTVFIYSIEKVYKAFCTKIHELEGDF